MYSRTKLNRSFETSPVEQSNNEYEYNNRPDLKDPLSLNLNRNGVFADRDKRANEWLNRYGNYLSDKYNPMDRWTMAINETYKGPNKNFRGDKRLTDVDRQRLELSADAGDFRGNIDEYKKDRMSGLLEQAKYQSEEGAKKIREGFSNRGLLYSGFEPKKQSEFRGQIASELAKSRAGINKEAEDIARRKEMLAASVGLENFGNLMNQAEQYYNMAAENDLNRRRALGNVIAGIGYGIGSFYGNKNPSDSYNDYSGSNSGGGLIGTLGGRVAEGPIR